MNFKRLLKKVTPKFLLGWYHYCLAFLGALAYGFPSRKLIIIGVTGTSGKTTTVDFITRILEEAGYKVASTSSIRFKVAEKEWKNEMKMSMGGRFKNQKFLRQAADVGCTHVVLEVTSEGIRQFRHKFINFDTAVFTNLSPEHLESHGGMEHYRNEKLKLFKATKNVHIINADDEHAKYFLEIPAKKIITFGKNQPRVSLQLLGEFNQMNATAAMAVAQYYGVSPETAKKALEKVKSIPGRMEIVSRPEDGARLASPSGEVAQNPLVIVDYAHTPEQLEQVYASLLPKKLVCVLGSCGGGRDKWKRPVLGKIAAQYCREIIITNEDPYDEDPLEIMEQVAEGVGAALQGEPRPDGRENSYHIVLDRKEAIKKALELATPEDAVIITGKGAEPLMCLADGKKIPWDDRQIVRSLLSGKM